MKYVKQLCMMSLLAIFAMDASSEQLELEMLRVQDSLQGRIEELAQQLQTLLLGKECTGSDIHHFMEEVHALINSVGEKVGITPARLEKAFQVIELFTTKLLKLVGVSKRTPEGLMRNDNEVNLMVKGFKQILTGVINFIVSPASVVTSTMTIAAGFFSVASAILYDGIVDRHDIDTMLSALYSILSSSAPASTGSAQQSIDQGSAVSPLVIVGAPPANL